MTFKVTITETLQQTVTVEATSRDEAEQMVSDQWRNSDHILDADNYVEVEFAAILADEQKATKMAHKDWCGKPCGECDTPCRLDESMPCSPDCEALNEDGSRNVEVCTAAGCDAAEKHDPGICPVCGSDRLDFDGFVVEGNSCIYKWRCNGCGVSGREWYDLIFSEHIIDRDDGA